MNLPLTTAPVQTPGCIVWADSPEELQRSWDHLQRTSPSSSHISSQRSHKECGGESESRCCLWPSWFKYQWSSLADFHCVFHWLSILADHWGRQASLCSSSTPVTPVKVLHSGPVERVVNMNYQLKIDLPYYVQEVMSEQELLHWLTKFQHLKLDLENPFIKEQLTEGIFISTSNEVCSHWDSQHTDCYC